MTIVFHRKLLDENGDLHQRFDHELYKTRFTYIKTSMIVYNCIFKLSHYLPRDVANYFTTFLDECFRIKLVASLAIFLNQKRKLLKVFSRIFTTRKIEENNKKESRCRRNEDVQMKMMLMLQAHL